MIREFSQGLSKIQNGERMWATCTDTFQRWLVVAGLGEYRLRDLNDELNKLLREKRHWEFRIAQLGGPDYTVSTTAILAGYSNT
jgi:pre-mRNA-splicing factor ISY1